MKKQFLLLVAVFVVLSTTLNAQNKDYRKVFSLTAGANIFSTTGKELLTGTSSDQIGGGTGVFKASPTFQVGYDYGFGKVFSLGLAVSYNNASGDVKNVNWLDANKITKTSDINIKSFSRTTIGLRALFHYGNKGKLDMYTGFRLGVGLWKSDIVASNKDFDPYATIPGLRNGALPQAQFIPFGLRGYVTDNIGIGFETAIGSPYFASLQLTYRVGSGKN